MTVPSSDGRENHPLQEIAGISTIRQLVPTINPAYSAKNRRFQLDAFRPFENDLTGSKVLVIDDTWVSGSTVQSLAHRVKRDGASTVVILTLGRWAVWDKPVWKSLIEQSINSATAFDVETCALNHV
ncbi:phosphoribosyltransferase [Stackebrandtia nassauensis]|uniref:Phosphoribosyltransferase n=1 Tax=Stackebrandtia nassauensis (strain DSM 44728 / CIP 108903 / NRRL B-16338 / NBRC 102104 / LLR-40K-21) TaxID=446470 RepID=D3PTZ4_STANL|nr:phosphoribosyltransferase [Stackebrandtia nassauensis]ADD39752.1 hypothetical protein Snas_0030 [Stackebrandtia nassauensis DSM 44728]